MRHTAKASVESATRARDRRRMPRGRLASSRRYSLVRAAAHPHACKLPTASPMWSYTATTKPVSALSNHRKLGLQVRHDESHPGELLDVDRLASQPRFPFWIPELLPSERAHPIFNADRARRLPTGPALTLQKPPALGWSLFPADFSDTAPPASGPLQRACAPSARLPRWYRDRLQPLQDRPEQPPRQVPLRQQ
jgi:hypothetical protein